RLPMRAVIDNAAWADPGRECGRHVGKAVYGLHRQTVLPQPLDLFLLGVERDRIGAVHQPIGELSPVARDRHLLIDVELLYESFAELQVEACGLTDTAAPDRGIVRGNLAA